MSRKTIARRDDIETVRELRNNVNAAHRRLIDEYARLEERSRAHSDLEAAVERLAGWDDDTIDVAGCSPSVRAMVTLWRRDGMLPMRGDC